MMDDITLALLGDHDAAQRVTERGELLTCPGCGNRNEVSVATVTRILPEFWGKCWVCGFCGPIESSVTKAISKWNTRAQVLTPVQLALLGIGREPRIFEEGSK